jgi:hypothetical protein
MFGRLSSGSSHSQPRTGFIPQARLSNCDEGLPMAPGDVNDDEKSTRTEEE